MHNRISLSLYLSADKPGPPDYLKSTSVKEDSVSLKFGQPKDDGGCLVSGYVIEQRDSGKRAWQEVVNTGDLEYIVTGLAEGHTYNFRVAAENEVGVGEFVELTKSIVPKSQHNPPGAPSAPVVEEVTKESCVLSWKAPEEDGGAPVTGYYIERCTTSSSRWLRITKASIPDTCYEVKELIEDTEYVFRITAENKVGEGPAGPKSEPVVAKNPWGEFNIHYA